MSKTKAGWKESGVEILVAVIGSSLIGTSLTTFYSDIYFQPYIDIKVTEHHNELSQLNTVDYYEILFKNTGQKYASNSKLNLFFFGDITKYVPVIHSSNVNFSEPTQNISSNSGQILPSLLSASLDKFPKNSIILIYVWVKPWEYSLAQQYLPTAYYISATYDEGSNHVSSSDLQTSHKDNIGNFIPYLKEDSDDFVSLTNISFVTIILSILAFAILFRIRRLKQIKKNASANSQSSQKQYDILFLLPLIFASSILIFFTEVYLKDIIFIYLPKGLVTLTDYFIPLSENIIANMSQFPFLIYGFFGVMAILIIKLLITYTICKFILKYSLNIDRHISFKLSENDNRKLFLLCALISIPIYTIIDYFFSIKVSSYTLLILMMFIEFIELSVVLYFSQKLIDPNKQVMVLTKLSKIFCSLSGIIYLVISLFIVKQFGDTFQINMFAMNFQDISSTLRINSPVPELVIFSFFFFLIVGIIQITWSLIGRKKIRNSIFYYAELAGLITLTILWLAFRIYLPVFLMAGVDSHSGYPGLFSLIPLILNLGLIIITLQILAIITDYVLIKKDSIILRQKHSRLNSPKILLSILAAVIIVIITPLILYTSFSADAIRNLEQNNYESVPSVIGYFPSNPDLFYLTSRDSNCILIVSSDTQQCIKTEDNSNLNSTNVDSVLDPVNLKLLQISRSDIHGLVINSSDFLDPYTVGKTYNSSTFNLGRDNTFFSKPRSYNNTLFLLYPFKKIVKLDLKTGNNASIDLERIVNDFTINPTTGNILIMTSSGYGVLNGTTGKEISFIPIPGLIGPIEYDPVNDQTYLSYRDFKENRNYIIVIKSNQIIQKFETNGFPLIIGVNKFPETEAKLKEFRECGPSLSVLMYKPSGIARYGNCFMGGLPPWQNIEFSEIESQGQ